VLDTVKQLAAGEVVDRPPISNQTRLLHQRAGYSANDVDDGR
jgi:hypothetical protein